MSHMQAYTQTHTHTEEKESKGENFLFTSVRHLTPSPSVSQSENKKFFPLVAGCVGVKKKQPAAIGSHKA